MKFDGALVRAIHDLLNPKEMPTFFWLERKIMRAMLQNINYVAVKWNYPYKDAGNDILQWANERNFQTHVIGSNDIMISW